MKLIKSPLPIITNVAYPPRRARKTWWQRAKDFLKGLFSL
jgi:hypothetical protein